MNNNERWNIFIEELRAYIEEHHHCPNKHCTLYNAQKYYRRKMREGLLSEEQSRILREILALRVLKNKVTNQMNNGKHPTPILEV